ncbi:hypothetical protein IZU99_02805 [Oscillospiraceae bacterium CM]|nr:hypothetical protein IZU99_02805 [Oscillospiraceae bacterium CM]
MNRLDSFFEGKIPVSIADIIKRGNNVEIKETKNEVLILEVSKKIVQRISK